MRGEIYTERDIVDLVRQGARRLELAEGDRLTDLARERARKEGLELVGATEIPEQAARRAAAARYAQAPAEKKRGRGSPEANSDLRSKVRTAVLAKLGSSVDPHLVDDIIGRVLRQLGR